MWSRERQSQLRLGSTSWSSQNNFRQTAVGHQLSSYKQHQSTSQKTSEISQSRPGQMTQTAHKIGRNNQYLSLIFFVVIFLCHKSELMQQFRKQEGKQAKTMQYSKCHGKWSVCGVWVNYLGNSVITLEFQSEPTLYSFFYSIGLLNSQLNKRGKYSIQNTAVYTEN